MRSPIAAAIAALSTLALLTAPAEASGHRGRCLPVIEGELERLQVAPDRIGNISQQVRRYHSRDDSSRVQGVLGWVALNDCAGRLVIDMSPRCRVKQSYTTGACSVAGVPSY